MVPHRFGIIPRLEGVFVHVVCEQGVVHMINFPAPVIYHYITVTPHVGKKRTEKAYSFLPGSSAKGEEWWSSYRYQLQAFVDKVRGRVPDVGHWGGLRSKYVLDREDLRGGMHVIWI